MVAVRSAHLNKAGEFDPKKWIASLGISSQQSCERLAETWDYCREKTQGHPQADLLLWRGVEMVEILSTLSMDIDTLRAALLFPLADGEVVSEEVMQESVGKSVVTLIHGVRDMAAIRQLKATHTDSVSSEQVDNIRRMLLAMVDDFRCVVIKLAERIAHLREVKDAPEDERVLAAKECTNIYAPLANRLGIGQLKWELEDYCFRYLHPAEYKRIAKLLHERRIDREHYIEEFVGHLRSEMKAEGVKAEVYGRPKHIYSIWRKMQKKHLAFDELFDVRAVRIVAERLQDCYAALGIVHTHYRHLPDEFDDYVANPKPNGYQSIHTVVLGPSGKTAARCSTKCAARSSTTGCMSLRRKATWWTCLRGRRRSTLPIIFTAMSAIAASAPKLAAASCRSPTSCRWAIRSKLLPRSSRTRAATG